MPALLIIGAAAVLQTHSFSQYDIGVVGKTPDSPFFAMHYVHFITIHHLKEGLQKIEHQKISLLVDPQAHAYWTNLASPQSYLAARLLKTDPETARYIKHTVSIPTATSYLDWLVPGILAMNMMFSAFYGVGYVLVRYRRNGVLRRLKATPLSAIEFLIAQMLSRLWLMFIFTTILFLGLLFVLKFPMLGSWAALLVVFFMGAFTLITLGLIIASRFHNEEVVAGLIDLISLIMMALSGVWFSLSNLNPWVQNVAQGFPLTQLLIATREIMFQGAGFSIIWPHLLALGLMSLCFLTIGAGLFRWE